MSPRPQFFRVLLPESLEKLVCVLSPASTLHSSSALDHRPCFLQPIPVKFARQLAKEIGGSGGRRTATIASSPNKFWHVELHGEEPEMFFNSGWPEFAAAHGLVIGYSMVFRYEGNMVFTAKVFDHSACHRVFKTQFPDTKEKSPFATQNKQFYKIFSPDCVQKLRIPSRFTQVMTSKCGNGTATLFTPLGKFRHIEFRQDGSDLIFGRGWAEFIRDYDIANDNILVFNYKGNTVFSVKVFDFTGCLKEYKARVSARKSAEAGMNVTNATPTPSRVPDTEEWNVVPSLAEPVSVNVFDFSGCLKEYKVPVSARKSAETSLNAANATPTTSRVPDSIDDKQNAVPSMAEPVGVKVFDFTGCLKEYKAPVSTRKSAGNAASTTSRVQDNDELNAPPPMAEPESSCHPWRNVRKDQYEKIITAYDLQKTFMVLPRSFCSSVSLLQNREIILKNSKQRSWPVKFCVYKSKSCLGAGWLAFRVENNIKLGDRCIFMHAQENVLSVQIVKSEVNEG